MCEAKIPGYWLSPFFCTLKIPTKLTSIKINNSTTTILKFCQLDRISMDNNGFITGIRPEQNLFLQDKANKIGSSFPQGYSQSKYSISFILPTSGASQMIKYWTADYKRTNDHHIYKRVLFTCLKEATHCCHNQCIVLQHKGHSPELVQHWDALVNKLFLCMLCTIDCL